MKVLALLHRVSPRGLRPKRSSQGFPLNVRVPGTRRVPLAGPLLNDGPRVLAKSARGF
jgi:hypothetical protein